MSGDRVRDSGVVDAPWQPVADAEVIAGHPSTRAQPLFVSDGPVEAGLWEMSEGAARDVEVDEVCLILATASPAAALARFAPSPRKTAEISRG